MDQSQIEAVLRELGAASLKKEGQNFLVSVSVLNKIIETADLSGSDSVLEIGSGLGVLTEVLTASSQKVVAIEKDSKFSAYLKNKFRQKKNFLLLNRDFLKINLPLLIQNDFLEGYKVVANIPYNISSLILKSLLELGNKPSLIVLLVQREVAQRVCAKPPHANPLSLFVQMSGVAEIVEIVPANCFFPEPKVASAILKIKTKQSLKIFATSELGILKKVIKVGFSSPRKTLVNNLVAGFKIGKEELEGAGILLEKKRPQELSLKDWRELTKKLSRLKHF
jgi:16S rRNA (adenine1518-N6/adenine1519-N6)-dimethyltransferase